MAIETGAFRAIRFSSMDGAWRGSGWRKERFCPRRCAGARRGARMAFVLTHAAFLPAGAHTRYALTCAVARPRALLNDIVRAYIRISRDTSREANKQEQRKHPG